MPEAMNAVGREKMMKGHGKNWLSVVYLIVVVAALVISGAITPDLALARWNNPRIAPIQSHSHGMTYGEWAGAWYQWAVGIPLDMNPILDETGEFGDIDQGGSVWFLAGTFGGPAERTLTIPPGKTLFFPLLNALWWAPNDLEFAAFVVDEYLGLDPDDYTDEELIKLTAIWNVTFEELEMTCTVDGVPLSNLEQYFAVSPGFRITDTDLIDDLGIPIDEENTAVAAGYWIMLRPLPPGEHTIRFTVEAFDPNPDLGEFDLDVTYDITVE